MVTTLLSSHRSKGRDDSQEKKRMTGETDRRKQDNVTTEVSENPHVLTPEFLRI